MSDRGGTRSKIVDETEVKRWFREGKTYPEMVEIYRTKYNIEVGVSMFGNFRRRHGMDRRSVRDQDLIPWEVRREHRYAHSVNMLRIEARRRAGKPVTEREEKLVDGFLRGLEQDDAVIHYEPETEQGWFRVTRRPGVDRDLIRAPDRTRTPALER